MYRHRYTSSTEYIVEQRHSRGWRPSSAESLGYRNWIAAGGIPEILSYREPVPISLEILRARKVDEIATAWKNDIEHVGMPVSGESFSVDYDIEDALLWEYAVNILAESDPSATEVEVRAIDNSFHTISRTLFESIPSLQKIYYQQQIQKKWALQKAALAAETIEGVERISWEG